MGCGAERRERGAPEEGYVGLPRWKTSGETEPDGDDEAPEGGEERGRREAVAEVEGVAGARVDDEVREGGKRRGGGVVRRGSAPGGKGEQLDAEEAVCEV